MKDGKDGNVKGKKCVHRGAGCATYFAQDAAQDAAQDVA